MDVYLRHGGTTVAVYHLGDRKAFRLRPVDSRDFVVNHSFAPGVSEVYIRVQTPDPMVLPVYLTTPAAARDRVTVQDYSYGALYGFLLALMAYNAMLYAGLREPRYLLYFLYLAAFLVMNVSYTGHGFKWIWPDDTRWEQWSNPVLMMLYGASGLIFALRFLDMRRHFPRLRKTVLVYLGISLVALLTTVLLDNRRDALLLAFSFVSLFTVIMLALGAISLRSGQRPARYFLLAAISAMIGAALTALSVWGFIPFNKWTFRAVDIGVMLDATLLALALTYQFRVGKEEQQRAETLAKLDPLTGLKNRRAFYDSTDPIWSVSLRHGHPLSVVLLDIDSFKRINDAYGHACGDYVLTATAGVLTDTIRKQDLAARWGGEEFILLLPETGLQQAVALAERLRRTIEAMDLTHAGHKVRISASFDVAQGATEDRSLDAVISTADT